MAATLLVEQFQPTHVLFTGIAGGVNPDLRPGDVVIGAKTAYHDYGEWTRKGFASADGGPVHRQDESPQVIELHDTNHYVFIGDEALVVREMRKFLLDE